MMWRTSSFPGIVLACEGLYSLVVLQNLSATQSLVSTTWIPSSWLMTQQVIFFLQLCPDFSGFKYTDTQLLSYKLPQKVSITTECFVWILLSTASSTELRLCTDH